MDWAREIGVTPHRDYVKVEPIFGAIKADACDVRFQFGHGGRRLFVGDMSDIVGRLTTPGRRVAIEAEDASGTGLLEQASSTGHDAAG